MRGFVRRSAFVVLGFVGGWSVAACTSSLTASSPLTVHVGQEFALAPGKSAVAEGTDLRVTFETVVSDSRCPADAVCIQAGEAVVALRIVEGPATSRHELSTGREEAREALTDAHRVRLERVEPYPYSGRRIEAADYRAILRITPR